MTFTNYFRSTQIFIFFVLLILLPLHDIDGVVNVSMALALLALIPDYRNLYSIRYILGAWALFAIWYLLSSVWNLFPEYTYSGLRKEVLYSIICLMIGFTAALHLRKVNTALYAVLVSLTLLSLATLARGGVSWLSSMEKYYPSVGDGSTSLVFFFSFAMALFFSKKSYSAIIAMFIVLTSLALAIFYENRMCFVSFASVIAACFLYTSKGLSTKVKTLGLFALLAIVLAIVTFSLSLKSTTESDYIANAVSTVKQDVRFSMWDFYFDKGMEKPMAGYGSGYHTLRDSFSDDFPETFNNFTKDHAHNVFLNKWLQMGLVGLILFLTLYSSALHKGITAEFAEREKPLKLLLLLVFVGFFSKSMTDDFFIRNNLLLFWLVTGFIIGRASATAAKPALT